MGSEMCIRDSPEPARVEDFASALKQRGVAVSVRASRGLDQNAACGQLRRQRQGGR